MATLSRFPRIRPGLSTLLKLSVISPLLVSAGGAQAQAQASCDGTSPCLAGQSYTFTVPVSPNPPSYSGYLNGDCTTGASSTSSSGTSGTSYVVGPLAVGECYYSFQTITGHSGDSTVVTAFPVFPANGISPQSLLGQYAFQLSGKTAGGQSGSRLVAAAGSFAADGQGNITSGVIDINSPAGIVVGESVTGTYQVNVNGVGIVNLSTSQGTLQFTLASPPLSFLGVTQYLGGSGEGRFNVSFPIVQGGTIATTAGGLVSASGTFVQLGIPDLGSGYQIPQPQTLQPATLNSKFFVNLSGQGSDSSALAEAAHFQFAAAGTVTADVTLAGNGTLTNLSGWTGTYTPFDPKTGRSVLTLTDPAQPNAAPQVYSVYEINQGQTLYLISTAPSLLTGRADQQ